MEQAAIFWRPHNSNILLCRVRTQINHRLLIPRLTFDCVRKNYSFMFSKNFSQFVFTWSHLLCLSDHRVMQFHFVISFRCHLRITLWVHLLFTKNFAQISDSFAIFLIVHNKLFGHEKILFTTQLECQAFQFEDFMQLSGERNRMRK